MDRNNPEMQLQRERDERKREQAQHAEDLEYLNGRIAKLTGVTESQRSEVADATKLVREIRGQLAARKRDTFRHRIEVLAPYVIGSIATAAIIGLIWWLVAKHYAAENMTAGMVVSRDYHPPYTTQVCTTANKVTTCIPVHHPERYSVTLADGHHDEREVTLTRDAWLQHGPSDWMCLTPGRCEPPHDDARNR